jgi:hypothetical protein
MADKDGSDVNGSDNDSRRFGWVQTGFTAVVCVSMLIQFITIFVLGSNDSFKGQMYATSAYTGYLAMISIAFGCLLLSFLSWKYGFAVKGKGKGKQIVPFHKTYWGKLYLLVVSAVPVGLSILIAGSTQDNASVLGRLYGSFLAIRVLYWTSIVTLCVTVLQIAVSHVWGYVRHMADTTPDNSLRRPERKSSAWVIQVIMVVMFAAVFVVTTVFLNSLYTAMLEAPIGGNDFDAVEANTKTLKPLLDTVNTLQMYNYLVMICQGATLVVFFVILCASACGGGITPGGSVFFKSLRAALSTTMLLVTGTGYAFVLQNVSYASHVQSLTNSQLLTTGVFVKPGDALMIWQTLQFWSFFGYIVTIHVLAFTHQ